MSKWLRVDRLAARWRTALAVLLGVVALGVVGMHLLSTGHELAVPSVSAHSNEHTHLQQPAHHHGLAALDGAVTVPRGVAVPDHHLTDETVAAEVADLAAGATGVLGVASDALNTAGVIAPGRAAEGSVVAASAPQAVVAAAMEVVAQLGSESGCAGCSHPAMFGACLLAFTFGVLWRLLARPVRSWLSMWTDGSMPPRASLTPASFSPALRRASLTHGELSISRT